MATTKYDSIERIWSGAKDKEYYGPDMTLGEVALIILRLYSDKVMQVFDPTGEELTGGQLLLQSRRLAHAFQRLRLQRGDVVGISATNTTYLTEVVIAALLNGTPINPLHPQFDSETVAYMYEITKPKVIFCDLDNYETLRAVKNSLKFKTELILLTGSLPGVRNIQDLLADGSIEYDEKTLFACPHLSGDDTAFIITSSGVTGLPKGVTRSHRSLLNGAKIPQLFTSETVLFCISPLYWISCVFTLLASLVNGCKRVITNRPFSVHYFADLVQRHRVSFVLTVPHQMALLARSPSPQREELAERMQSVRSFVCSGSKVPLGIWRRLYELLGADRFAVLYGLSEVGGISKNVGGPLGSEGKLLRNVQVRILDEQAQALGPNQTGQIHVRLGQRWGGYYHNPQDTQMAITPDGQWLLTGDHGYFDDDGCLHFQTRDSDVFKYNHFPVYPKQIEDVVHHLPGVHEVAIFGIPDEISTNLTACAVVRDDSDAGRAVTANDITGIVEQHLSEAFHIRGGVFFVDNLPKTQNQKIQRRRILAELNEITTHL
ncbi:LOW QUALITY PROTEIN: luciferin 4-monooxygenase [Drosophila subobscura]|uniref:LOW QUALITY PROTEIN: luciferin 4-monooxygenase n=1 Tax=Drosophila subobscura TaxID=7241 RepID=UPI00155B1846|nr:LOW QUALITY PROTEIN: luciferin 4-monooxygenase [Drosophila subobscura]